jgi:hypothetical protein
MAGANLTGARARSHPEGPGGQGAGGGLAGSRRAGTGPTFEAMTFEDTPSERRSLVSGMRVRAADGTLLGYVALIGQEHLYVRRSPFVRHTHWKEVPLSAIRRVFRGAVVLKEGTGPLTAADAAFHGEIPTQTLPLVLEREREPEPSHA